LPVYDCGSNIDRCREAVVVFVTPHCNALEFLKFTEKVLDKVALFIHILTYLKWFAPSRHLRNNHFGAKACFSSQQSNLHHMPCQREMRQTLNQAILIVTNYLRIAQW